MHFFHKSAMGVKYNLMMDADPLGGGISGARGGIVTPQGILLPRFWHHLLVHQVNLLPKQADGLAARLRGPPPPSAPMASIRLVKEVDKISLNT